MITLSKLAKLCHVSVSTVSKAFSMSNEVNEQTREMIFEVARQNNCFRELFNARYPKYVVAIVCPEFHSTYYSSTLSLLQSYLSQYNCEITVASTNFSHETERELLNYYSKYTTVDAIINYGLLTEKSIQSEIPIINMCASDSNINYIRHDYTDALSQAVDHLKKNGAKKIGFISENHTIKKLDLFYQALKEQSVEINENYIAVTPERFEKGGYLAMQNLIDGKDLPDAVICGYDDMAIGAMRCAFDNGLEIPKDIMVMGMNDIGVSAYIQPSLSTIDLKNAETCKAATDMLIARVNGNYYPENVVIKCDLKLRETTNRNL